MSTRFDCASEAVSALVLCNRTRDTVLQNVALGGAYVMRILEIATANWLLGEKDCKREPGAG